MSADSEMLLARMRVAVCRLRVLQADIEEVGVALKAGRISASGALYWLQQNDVDDLCRSTAELEAEAA